MRVEKNVPEIRFEGFSGEWKISQLSELALFNPKEELPVTFKYVDLESVKGTSLLGYREELKESAPSRAQRLAKKGDVFFQTVRPYQKNNYLFNMEEIDFVFSTGYAQLRPYCDGNFLLNLIQRDSFVKDVLDNCTGTSYPAINASILASLEVISPEGKEEQTAIGNTFQKLDNLINQHQQKHDKLSNIKKAMLEKMFPKQGETIPEIRFKGFSGEWEEVCVGEIAKTSIGEFVKQTKQKPDSPYPVFNGGKSFTGHYDDYNNEGDKILVSARGANAGFVNYQKTRFWAGNSCYSIDVSSKEENYTIFVYFSIKRTQHLFTDFQQAANIPSVSKADVEKFKFMSPKFEEQAAIGNYFQKLDTLINQHQQQITKLNNIKQACLSKMFV